MAKDLKKYLADKKKIVDSALDNYLPALTETPISLHEAMRYSVLSNGKRIRPILMLEVFKALGGTSNALPAAVSLEFIHCFSLIHDDLPILDNDDFRRGIPTCHKKYGDAMALLAGDALLAHAFYILAHEQSKYCSAEVVVKLNQELSKASSTYGITGGQVVDILAEKGLVEHTSQNLDYIHNFKTGSLIVASIRMGAILAGASDHYLNLLTKAAKNVGLAFQIKDDVLDEIGDEKALGKAVGRDKELGKLTYVSVYGLKEARTKYEELLEEALSLVDFLGESGEVLRSLFKFIVNRQY